MKTRYKHLAFLGFTYYRVGDDGSLQSRWNNRWISDQWKPVKGSPTKAGYIDVGLRSADGRRKRLLLHQLILTAFIGPCPEGMECRHLDGNPANNRLSNLCWGTRVEQAADRNRHGTTASGIDHPHAKFEQCDIAQIHRDYTAGKSATAIAKERGVRSGTIAAILSQQTYKEYQPEEPAEYEGARRWGNGKLQQHREEIRRSHANGETQTSIARRLGVTQAAIWYVLNNRTYRQ